MLPPDFDPKAKYPLLVHVYGEPAGQTVLDRWGGGNQLWHRMLAQHGYVVMSFDNRGTPAPKGRAWRKAVYRKIGILAPQDQAAAVKAVLKERPYLDPKRVGVWGWSGGGSMSLERDLQVSRPLSDRHRHRPGRQPALYDTIYQERYMGLPGDNVEGFIQGSPINFAHQLKGNLLLDPRHGRRQLPLPGDRGPDQRADPPRQAVHDDGLPQPLALDQRGAEHDAAPAAAHDAVSQGEASSGSEVHVDERRSTLKPGQPVFCAPVACVMMRNDGNSRQTQPRQPHR